MTFVSQAATMANSDGGKHLATGLAKTRLMLRDTAALSCGASLLEGSGRMASARNVRIGAGGVRRRTSLRLEQAYMDALDGIAVVYGISLDELVTRIDEECRAAASDIPALESKRAHSADNLSRACRVYVLRFFQQLAMGQEVSRPAAAPVQSPAIA